MQDNPEVGELDAAVDNGRRCKEDSPSVLSCIEMTKEDCDRDSEDGTVHSERG